jgi:hypothetical protein
LLRAEALAEELKDEETLLAVMPEQGGGADARPLSAKKELWEQTIGKMTSGESPGARLAAMLQSARQDEASAVAAWRSAAERSLSFDDQVAEAETRVGWSWVDQGPSGNLPAGLIVLGLLAVTGGWLLALHEVRDRLRQRLRALGSRPSLVAVALAAPMAVACVERVGASDDAGKPTVAAESSAERRQESGNLARRRAELQQHLAAKEQANAAVAQRLARRLGEVRRRAMSALRPENPFQKSLANRAEAVESDLQERFQEARVSARVTSSAASEARRAARGVRAGQPRRGSSRQPSSPRRLRSVRRGCRRPTCARSSSPPSRARRGEPEVSPLSQTRHTGDRRNRVRR